MKYKPAQRIPAICNLSPLPVDWYRDPVPRY